MNKREVIVTVANKYDITQKQAEDMVGGVLDLMYNAALSDGEARFGTHVFKRKVRPARKGTNPRTGEKIDIKESTVVQYMRTASFLKEQE